MDEKSTHWDDVYTRGTDWGMSFASDFLWRCLDWISPGGKVLDLGSGTGRNALFLSSLGYQVTALDISEVALGALRKSALSMGLSIVTIREDVSNARFPGEEFDAVLAYGLLNSMPRDSWNDLLSNMKSWVRCGGVGVISYFNSYSSASSVDAQEVAALAEPDYALAQFADWTVIGHDSRCETHSHGSRPKHVHVTERLVVRKVPVAYSRSIPSVVAVVGPTNLQKAELTGPISAGSLLAASQATGRMLAATGRQLLCIPDDGVGRAVFTAFTEAKPRQLAHILAPPDDPHLADTRRQDWLDRLGASAIIDKDVTWEQQPRILVEKADAIVALGMSVGSTQEILWTKWFPRPVFLALDLCSRLPIELRRDLTIFEFPDISSLLNYLSRVWGK